MTSCLLTQASKIDARADWPMRKPLHHVQGVIQIVRGATFTDFPTLQRRQL